MNKKEQVITLPISELHSFPGHPFSISDGDEMKELVKSINDNGVLTPIMIRINEENQYEIISGHRRVHACMQAGITEIPVVIKNCTREEAIVLMVDSNLQRENIPPCERGLAYKMKVDALNKQGKRTDIEYENDPTSFQNEKKLKGQTSLDKVAADSKQKPSKIFRLIRLSFLIPDLQEVVNSGKLGVTTAYELSFLKPEEQKWVMETIESESAVPNFTMAQKMKIRSKDGTLTEDNVLDIMTELKKTEQQYIRIDRKKVQQFLPSHYTPQQEENVIIKLLESWFKYRVKKEQEKAQSPTQQKESKPKSKSDQSR